MAPREKQTLTGDRVITGRLTVYGGVNSPDVVKNITDVATTKEQVTQLETTVQEIADEPFGPAIRSSAPAIVIKADGTVSPEEITFQGVVKPLNGDPSFYLGIFKIYKDGDLYYTTPTAVTSLTWTVDIVQSLTPGPEVYPAINLYPSFSNRLITIELYDDTGTDLKDTLNISILPSWESYIQNELSGYTPKYIGKFNAAHPSSYHNGDWWLVYDTDDTPITRGVYRAINYTPTLVDGSDAANSQFMVAALPDILWASNNSYGDLSDYAPITYISNLVANAAFISNLFAQYIKIQTGGSIRGGDRYDEDGAVIDGTKPGFFIGASGACKVAGIEFDGTYGADIKWGAPSKVGSTFSTSTVNWSAMCRLDSDKIAFMGGNDYTLKTLRWDGSQFSQIGSGLVVSGLNSNSHPRMTSLSDTLVVIHYSNVTPDLRVYSWSGSAWSQVDTDDSGLDGFGGICALSETDFALCALISSSLSVATWRFNGSVLSQIGNTLDISYSGYGSIASISDTEIVLLHSGTGRTDLTRLSWDGTDWSVTSTQQISSSYQGTKIYDLAVLSRNDVVVTLAYGGASVYRWNGSGYEEISNTNFSPSLSSSSGTSLSGTDVVMHLTGGVSMYRYSFALSRPWSYPFNP